MKKYTQQDIEEWNKNPAKPTVPVQRHWKREHWIANFVQQHGWTRGAELGVWRGRTFLHLLSNCPKLTLYGVDLWSPQPDNDGPEQYLDWDHEAYERSVRAQSQRFGARAVIIKASTNDALQYVDNESLDFVFIDADHSSEAVRQDIINWSNKVKETGWIIGHDINWPTVQTVVEELLPRYIIGPDNAWARKKVI